MDIYQIFTTYNKPWSKHEVLAFCLVLVLASCISIYYIYKKKISVIRALALIALIAFLGIVFGATVFTREKTTRQYELIPFWSWIEIIKNGNRPLLKENLLNCLLLLPAGTLLPLLFGREVKWYQALLFGLLISATIEFCQLIFMRGLFEWDDMIHNGIGCMIGNMLTNLLKKLIRLRRE